MRPSMPENSKKMTNLRQVSPARVVVLAYDGLCTFEFGVAVEIFGLPRPKWARAGIGLRLQAWMKASYGPRGASVFWPMAI